MDTMALETITTVPTYPLQHPSLAEEILRLDRERTRHRKPRNPFWTNVVLYLGGVLLLGSGTFVLTLGLVR